MEPILRLPRSRCGERGLIIIVERNQIFLAVGGHEKRENQEGKIARSLLNVDPGKRLPNVSQPTFNEIFFSGPPPIFSTFSLVRPIELGIYEEVW